MRKLLYALAAIATLSAPAQAVEMDIGLSSDGGATISTIGTDATGFFFGGAAFGGFTNGFVVGFPPTLPSTHYLNGNSVNIATGVAPFATVLDVYITIRDLPSSSSLGGFASQFDVVGLTAGWDVTAETLFSSANALYAGTQLSTAFFNTPASGVGPLLALGNAAGDFSVTGHFTINTHDIVGGFNGGVDIAAVPGPLVGAGIPGLLALLGGMYAFYRRRRA